MKSLLERAIARPSYFIGIVIAVIAILFILWWILSPSKQQTTTQAKPSIIANQKIITPPVKQPEASAPAITAANTNNSVDQTKAVPASAPTVTAPSVAVTNPTVPTVINAALPKDPAIAAEELDRLKDEQVRLKERKKELSKQLAISNKLVALKDQQLKDLGQSNP